MEDGESTRLEKIEAFPSLSFLFNFWNDTEFSKASLGVSVYFTFLDVYLFRQTSCCFDRI
jgi:hypothetical protein